MRPEGPWQRLAAALADSSRIFQHDHLPSPTPKSQTGAPQSPTTLILPGDMVCFLLFLTRYVRSERPWMAAALSLAKQRRRAFTIYPNTPLTVLDQAS